MTENTRICIVGGVAGGASCAARARRLNESAEIIMLERGPYVSFANCGLPYYVGNVITEENDLLVATPKLFRDRFRIDVRTGHNVTGIVPDKRTISVETTDGRMYTEPYDALVLATGSSPLKPPIAGIDHPGVFTLWTVPDSRDIRQWIRSQRATRAVVIGGGFIGLEMAENLRHRGLDVQLVEMLPQVMPPLDPELAAPLHRHLSAKGIRLHLNAAVTRIGGSADGSLQLGLSTGRVLDADMVLAAAGIRPNTELAAAAGLEIGASGGIRVDSTMRTSRDHIWAVGDAVENHNTVSGLACRLPLAGPANRQGRLAAESILGTTGKDRTFRGVQGTSVCGILGMTVAATGLSEKELKRIREIDPETTWEKIYIHPDNHAGYYPGARSLTLKLIFSPEDGRVLGAQAVGTEGVDKRIDVIATAIQHRGTVFDLEAAELCYAPQYGSAKDPVNVAGMVAANAIHDLAPIVHWPDVETSGALILDVRTKKESRRGNVAGAVHIPLNDIRKRSAELPTDRDIWCHCHVGLRSYIAVRILRQLGYRAFNLSGGYLMYLAFKDAAEKQDPGPDEASGDMACRELRFRIADGGLGSGN